MTEVPHNVYIKIFDPPTDQPAVLDSPEIDGTKQNNICYLQASKSLHDINGRNYVKLDLCADCCPRYPIKIYKSGGIKFAHRYFQINDYVLYISLEVVGVDATGLVVYSRRTFRTFGFVGSYLACTPPAPYPPGCVLSLIGTFTSTDAMEKEIQVCNDFGIYSVCVVVKKSDVQTSCSDVCTIVPTWCKCDGTGPVAE